MIISCWSVKLLKLPSVTLTHVCGTNSHNWWATGLPGVVTIFYDSDSSGWKSFRLHSPGLETTELRQRFFAVVLRKFPYISKAHRGLETMLEWKQTGFPEKSLEMPEAVLIQDAVHWNGFAKMISVNIFTCCICKSWFLNSQSSQTAEPSLALSSAAPRTGFDSRHFCFLPRMMTSDLQITEYCRATFKNVVTAWNWLHGCSCVEEQKVKKCSYIFALCCKGHEKTHVAKFEDASKFFKSYLKSRKTSWKAVACSSVALAESEY